MNLKKYKIRFLLIVVFCFLLKTQLFAEPVVPNHPIILKLENGSFLQFQTCSDQIFRIRLSEKNEFPESLMERYGIIKTDWKQADNKVSKKDGNQRIQTSGYQFIINEANGDITVKDSAGHVFIEQIRFQKNDSEVSKKLGQSLNTYFGKNEKGGGIIGDSKYTGEKSEFTEIDDLSKATVVSFSLKNDERFYGGGSTSRKNIQHRGEVLRMWATYQKTEIPMPFIMSSSGWGILNNTTSKNYFDIGRFRDDRLCIYNTDGTFDFYFMPGSSMPEIINQYTTVTGKPYLLPQWAYGLAFGGNMMEDQFDILDNAIRFRETKIPCDIFWLEPQWMAKYYDFSTSKNWDYKKFPAEPFWEETRFPKYEAPNLFVSRLHNLGYKLGLWLCIDHDLSIEEEDYLAKKSGSPLSGEEHWFPHLTRFIDQGVDGFKLDPGRTLDEHPDRKYYNGYTDKEMHNLNQVLLSKQMYTTFRNHSGIRSFHHYCGGYAGSQHWGASTSGDNGGGKLALYDQLNLSMSGFLNSSVDVLEACDLKEGLHFGFFLPWVQINSWYAIFHPWYLSPGEKETYRFYAQLRNRLFPYIYSAAIEGTQTGMPVLRAMPLVFPDDRKVDNMVSQYMFGENLLVGVFSDSIYLPKGNWINYWTGQSFGGEQTLACTIPENRGGQLFVRKGAIIPYQPIKQFIGDTPIDTLILDIYPDQKSSYTLYEDDGISFDYEKRAVAKTRFECIREKGKTEFCIDPCEGEYRGISPERTYLINIHLDKKPETVLINGQQTDNWQIDNLGIFKITISKHDIRKKEVITVQ